MRSEHGHLGYDGWCGACDITECFCISNGTICSSVHVCVAIFASVDSDLGGRGV